ncbi:cell division protein FtsZ [archaeon]|jgi:cell division protein FtsZ|nr:cell division protein FtsZ [archaeon]MBT6823882.1 cell division protein FtsZ [archaeon]MBT7107213.1 cell division protein FtsZ [archaeon]MBT7297824.1 cell division protein FtsZ [archaeon]
MEFIIQDALKNAEQNDVMDVEVGKANIQVIGVGGAGNNMVSWLYKKGINGAEITALNTDKQHLDISSSDTKYLIGKELTRGLGCGGYIDKGRDAAREDLNQLRDIVKGADMTFICAGMGGGTGTGAAPVVAQLAKESGSIVIGTVTMPFNIERARIDKAEFGLQQLREVSDTVIVIDNNRLVKIAGELPIKQAFAVANELVSTMIKGIVEIIAVPSLVNLDYADVKTIMTNGGVSAIGIGESSTENRVEEAVNRALSNPLLEVSYTGATGALIHITGGDDFKLEDVSKIGDMITSSLDPDANVIWGARIEKGMEKKLRIMTIITGVTSPYILGKTDPKAQKTEVAEMSNELGIDSILH